MEQMGYDENNAQQIIRQMDHDSSGYINAHFDADWDDGNLYDIVLNTQTMFMDACSVKEPYRTSKE